MQDCLIQQARILQPYEIMALFLMLFLSHRSIIYILFKLRMKLKAQIKPTPKQLVLWALHLTLVSHHAHAIHVRHSHHVTSI